MNRRILPLSAAILILPLGIWLMWEGSEADRIVYELRNREPEHPGKVAEQFEELIRLGRTDAILNIARDRSVTTRFVRPYAIRILSRTGDPELVPFFADLMGDPKEWIRLHAILALRWIGTKEAEEQIFKTLTAAGSTDEEQALAIFCLGELESKAALPEFRTILKARFDPGWKPRRHGSFQGFEYWEPSGIGAHSEGGIYSEPEEVQAVVALGKIDDPTSIPLLIEAAKFQDDHWMIGATYALKALASSPNPEARSAVQAFIDEPWFQSERDGIPLQDRLTDLLETDSN